MDFLFLYNGQIDFLPINLLTYEKMRVIILL